MLNEPLDSFLGQGWAFPPRFDTETKVLALVREQEDISQSLYILLHTEPGERVMNPEYGCALRQFLFAGMNLSERTHLEAVVKRAILRFEPRVTAQVVRTNIDRINDGVLLLEIDYTVRSLNSRHNVVFPFYRREATLLA
jgi:phage baseplate assembly protein W